MSVQGMSKRFSIVTALILDEFKFKYSWKKNLCQHYRAVIIDWQTGRMFWQERRE